MPMSKQRPTFNDIDILLSDVIHEAGVMSMFYKRMKPSDKRDIKKLASHIQLLAMEVQRLRNTVRYQSERTNRLFED
jgi:hypothetical protein